LLKVIEMADDAHHVMYTSVKKEYAGQDGILGGFGYSVLSHTTWDKKDFIQLRNQWAGGEFNGTWSDKDTTTDAT